ncbi:MAG: hypothetical protein WCJ64_05765 [Rhodospirillaceae bacterium]
MIDSEQVEITVNNVRKYRKGPLLATVDIIVYITGIEFTIQCVTVKREDNAVVVQMPETRNSVGHPISALLIPQELHEPICLAIADVVGLKIVEAP